MNDFLDDPKNWAIININLIIGFLFGISVPVTAWILLIGFFKIPPFERSLAIGATVGLPFGIINYYYFLF